MSCPTFGGVTNVCWMPCTLPVALLCLLDPVIFYPFSLSFVTSTNGAVDERTTWTTAANIAGVPVTDDRR